jgi:hypothetical protein
MERMSNWGRYAGGDIQHGYSTKESIVPLGALEKILIKQWKKKD